MNEMKNCNTADHQRQKYKNLEMIRNNGYVEDKNGTERNGNQRLKKNKVEEHVILWRNI
jgi:hypothetical protein